MSQMKDNPRRSVVMSLFAHSRGFGIAIMEDALTVLNAYNVVLHSYPIKNKNILKKVKEKIDFYLPGIIILEDANGFGSRKGKRTKRLIGLIEEYAKSKDLKISKYSRNDIRFVFDAFNASSKYEIAKVITENVKNLPVDLPEKRKSHEPEHYSMNIFDAIALGITHCYHKN